MSLTKDTGNGGHFTPAENMELKGDTECTEETENMRLLDVTDGTDETESMKDDTDFIGEFQPDAWYTRKKTMAKGCLDLALLMANVSQLKTLVSLPRELRTDFHTPLISMIISSLCLQVVIGAMLVWLVAVNPVSRGGHRRLECINNVCVGLIVLLTVLNCIISSFDNVK